MSEDWAFGLGGFRFRPIERWPGERSKYSTRAPFSASWTSTTRLLARELHNLKAKNVVMQVALIEMVIGLV